MYFTRRYRSPFGYINKKKKLIDSYGVDHSDFSTRDELEYQSARLKREEEMMEKLNNRGIHEYPQYSEDFWG